jgi:lysophospholipase L1-like esterase
MANKPTIPNFPTLPDFGQMITQACEVVASVRGIPYDFNGTLSLENKFVVLFKTVKEMFDAQDELVKSYKALHAFINQYFSNLDLQNEVNKKIEEMKKSGELLNLLKPTVSNEVAAWLTANITNPSNPPIDKSLTVENAAADAKTTGDKIASVKENLVGLENINNILDYHKIDNISILTTGNIEIVDNWYSTDFINVTGCNEYFVNGIWKKPSNPKYASVIYFDSEMNIINYINETGTQTYNMEKISFPINTAYVRFCFGKESTVQIFMNIPDMNERVGLKTAQAIFHHKISAGGTVDNNDSYVTSNLIPINKETNFITVKKGTSNNDKSSFYISFWSRPSTASKFLVKGYNNYALSENFTNIKIPNGANYFCFSWPKEDYPPMYKQDSDISENKTPIDVIGKYMTLNAPDYNYRICLIGDSITQGMGSSGFQQYDAIIDGHTYNVRGNGPNNPNATSNYKIGEYLWTSGGRRWYEALDGNGWAQLFKNYMNEKFNIIVRNFGMSGIDSGDLKYFINNFMDTLYNFDCIVMMIGTNNRQFENLESFYTDINDTIKTIKNYGKDLIIMASIPSSIVNEKEFHIHMEDIHNALRQISCENKIPFISVYNLFIDYCSNKGIKIDTLLSDGLHPNNEGYKVMFQLISNAMGIALKRPDATW